MAKLPNIDAAIVEDTKLKEYLLNPAHPRGAAKANFLARFGFSADQPEQAREAFLEHAQQYDFSASQQTRFGVIFEVDGPLPSPMAAIRMCAPCGCWMMAQRRRG